MGFMNYIYFLAVLIEYKIEMLLIFFKYGKFWQGLWVDNDYFYPYTFKLMAKSYFGALQPWEEKLYKEIRVKHNNSHKDHWEYYVCNNEAFPVLDTYEVAEITDEADSIYSIQLKQSKEILCMTEKELKAEVVCKKMNTKFVKPYMAMPDAYTVLMIKRWELEGDVEAKLSKYLDGDYFLDVNKVFSFAIVLYPYLKEKFKV